MAETPDDDHVCYYRAYPALNPVVVATFVAVELCNQQIVVAAVEAAPVS